MAQIQTYPRKTTYDANDLILICDKTPDENSVITNETKTVTISTIADNLNVVETLNGLKGNINITAGANITVTPSGQNIQISTSSSNVDGSGTANTIPKWSDSNTLTDSPFTIDTSINSLDIPTFIRHIGDTDSQFGFQADNHFRLKTGGQTTIQSISRTDENSSTGQVAGLYFDSSERFFTRTDGVEIVGSIFMPGYIKHLGDNDSLFGFAAPNNFIIDTDSGRKIAAGPDGVTLYSDTSLTANTTSFNRLNVNTTGVIIYGQTTAAGASSDQGGLVKYYSAANNRYVGISGPTTTGTSYILKLPDSVGTADQVLKLPSTPGTTNQLVWGDAVGSIDGSGTANKVATFIDSDTIGDGIMTENPAGGFFAGKFIDVTGNGGIKVNQINIGGKLLDSNNSHGSPENVLFTRYDANNNVIGTKWDAITIPLATPTTVGGVKMLTTQSTQASQPITTTVGRTYSVQFNGANVPVVNVPWTDTSSAATASSVGGIKLNSDLVLPAISFAVDPPVASKNYGVQINALGKAGVHVPWENTTDITLTTNGTSGAATWNGTTLNIPNYTPSSPGVQSLTVTQGSGTGLDYVSISSQSTAVGNVNLGFVNLTATNFPGGGIPTPGVDDIRFLIKDNYWASLWPAQVNFLGGIQLSSATVQTVAPNAVSSTASKTYSVQLDSNNKAVVNVPWSTEITLTTTGASGAATWNGTTLNIPQYTAPGVGLSPMSIYEGEVEVGTVSLGGDATFARQTTVESTCTINKVQFFRVTGTNEISIYVYEGQINDPANADLVLAGTLAQSSVPVNSINELAFSKTGYTSHTFGAGTPIIIVVCFKGGDGGANALGNDTLKRLTGLAEAGSFYVAENSVPLTYSGLTSSLEEGNQYGVSMHFFNKP